MSYLQSVRGRMLCIAFVPGGALVLVALVIAVFLIHQANQTRDSAFETADAADRTTREVADLQARRSAAMSAPDRRSTEYAIFTQRIDTAIAGLRDYARRAPDAESGYQQTTAVELLSVAEGMNRADCLALAGIDGATRRPFADAVAGYRAELARVAPGLPASGRLAYESLVGGADWRLLVVTEDALVAAEAPPLPESTWRGAANAVSRQLDLLYSRQSQYAVQLTLDDGRRTLAGAVAASAALLLGAGLLLVVVRRLIARVPVPVVPIIVPAVPRPRHARSPRPQLPAALPLKAVLDDLRRR